MEVVVAVLVGHGSVYGWDVGFAVLAVETCARWAFEVSVVVGSVVGSIVGSVVGSVSWFADVLLGVDLGFLVSFVCCGVRDVGFGSCVKL